MDRPAPTSPPGPNASAERLELDAVRRLLYADSHTTGNMPPEYCKRPLKLNRGEGVIPAAAPAAPAAAPAAALAVAPALA
jgi:hypothetical protein